MDISRDYERQIADLSFRLTESQRFSKYVQSKLQTLDATNHKAEIAQLQFKATESLRIVRFSQEAFMKADQEKQAMEANGAAEKAKRMFQISEADRMIQFLSNKLKDTESKYEAKIKDLEFKLAEASVISKSQEFVGEQNELNRSARSWSVSNGKNKFSEINDEGELSVAYPNA
jgi:hypothetical protein